MDQTQWTKGGVARLHNILLTRYENPSASASVPDMVVGLFGGTSQSVEQMKAEVMKVIGSGAATTSEVASLDPADRLQRKQAVLNAVNASMAQSQDAIVKLLDRIETITYGRVVAYLQSEGFAPVPSVTEVGDSIGILDGLRCHVVLRRKANGTHSLVGDAFVEGTENDGLDLAGMPASAIQEVMLS